MIEAVEKKIKESTNIAVMAHINEDGDALGSVFALCHILKNMNKQAVCFLDKAPEKRLEFLDGEYKLYNNESSIFDLCMILDCADAERIGEARMELFKNAKSRICIDHHATNRGYADINIIEPEKSSAAEVLFGVLKKCGFSIDDYAAKCLYTGIASDSGCFKYSNTSPETMRIAAELMEYKFDHAEVLRLLFDTESIENIRLKGYVMNNIESFENGKIQLISTDEKILSKFGVNEKDVSDLVNIPRSVKGCEIAAELKKRDGKLRLSLRSNRIDVSEIAQKFGGGGHKLAAGAEICADTMENAKKMVIKECVRKLGATE